MRFILPIPPQDRTLRSSLIGWDTHKNTLYRVIYLAAPIVPHNSFLNDLAVDRKNNAIYITDTAAGSNAALIVVDLHTGEARRVLEGSTFTIPEDKDMVIDGKVVQLNGKPARIGVNPITIDHNSDWVYFAPMTGERLYRIQSEDLLDSSLNEQSLRKRVEDYAYKPISDGISIDNDGNIYITDITANALGYIDAQRQYHVIAKDRRLLSWTDGLALGADKKVYATANQLHKSPVLNGGENTSDGHYYILDFDAYAKTTVGR